MSQLKLYGMRAAYDAVMASGIKRRHEPARLIGDLLAAEIPENRRALKYQLTIAKLPLAKDIEQFDFAGTPINEALIRDLAPAAANRISRSPSHAPASAAARRAASSPSSTSSTGWRAKPDRAARGVSPIT